jgi:superfamily II DNA/RNA helicase
MNKKQTRQGRGGSGFKKSSKPGNRKFNKEGSFKKKQNFGGKKRGGRKIPTFNPSMFINTNPIEIKEEVYVPTHGSFADFDINPKLAEIVTKMGIKVPSPIQDQTIPASLEGRDVIGLAETGTGKTAAFLVPLIEQTMNNRDMTTLILAPTRELAIQIQEEARKISRNIQLYSVTCVGGLNIQPQIRTLKRKNHFIIGTPGRVLDLIQRGKIKTEKINAVVLDEADRMLDMGFIHDMRKILSSTPEDRQTLFFSATMTPAAKELTREFLKNPVTVSVKKKDVTDSIQQDVVPYKAGAKLETLTSLFSNEAFNRVIVFGEMKHSVERLSKDLQKAGIKATSIHGNKTHGQRQRSLQAFKKGEAKVLVATDVAARGIHVDDVSHVINYDLPQTFEDYVHRIGRTGRGTKRGKALTFISK